MKTERKDIELALILLAASRRKLGTVARCEQLMQHNRPYSATFLGLARRAQHANAQARMCIQAARMLHPATTPATPARAQPVPPKAGPAVVDYPGCTTLEQAVSMGNKLLLCF